ncbi:MAG: hypothetical protein U1E95_01800 [Rubrivivax sp.]
MLKAWGRQHDLVFVPEYELDTATRDRRYDGALLHELRMPFGYWEAKDEKRRPRCRHRRQVQARLSAGQHRLRGQDQAVLIQHREEVMRCDVADVAQLEKLLKLFFAYERPEIAGFRKAVACSRPIYRPCWRAAADDRTPVHAQRSLPQRRGGLPEACAGRHHPGLSEADVREMLIQHVLTEEIFAKVFDDSDFHRKNNVAHELYKPEETFFTGG